MICIPITSDNPKEALHAIERSCQLADFLELRMDLIGNIGLAELISAVRAESAAVKIIVTSRKKEEAAFIGRRPRRRNACSKTRYKIALLKEAVERGADYIDIELAEGTQAIRQLQALCAEKGSQTKMIISYHHLKDTPDLATLKKIFHRCAAYKPAVVKIVTTARSEEDNLIILNLIAYARRKSQKIISLCMGEKGGISRAVAPLMGNFLSFAALDRTGRSAPGQFTVHEMNRIQKWFKGKNRAPQSSASSPHASLPRHYVLLGNPVEQSLSPVMHDAALKKTGLAEQYVAFCVQDIGGAMDGLRAMNIHGASVTIPFKVAVMEYLDDIDADALEIGAVNTIVNENGRLIGHNTDWAGLILTLKKAMTIRHKTIVIVGAGGTARAAAYGILKEGGCPVIVNRTPKKGKMLAEKMQCAFYPLSEIGRIRGDVLINTTPVGMYPRGNQSPVSAAVLSDYDCVMDVIYNPIKTKLLRDAEKQGCRIVTGVEMFVNQGAEQFRLWTGKEPPHAVMKKIILERLSKGGR